MRLLLDTHALLWWFTDDPRLSAKLRAMVGDMSNEILVSSACAWEISTKHRLGKLDQAAEAVTRFEELIAADAFVYLPISHRHALRAGSYPASHRDRFDRILAAQAEIESIPLATLDKAFAQFGIDTLW